MWLDSRTCATARRLSALDRGGASTCSKSHLGKEPVRPRYAGFETQPTTYFIWCELIYETCLYYISVTAGYNEFTITGQEVHLYTS